METELSITNMATNASMDLIREALHPGIFRQGDDIEQFIKACTKYFECIGVRKKEKSLLVVGLIDRDLREAYECQDELLEFDERLRKAFHKKTTLIQDLEEALKYKRTDEHIYVYKKKIQGLVEKILTHQLDKEELTKELIINSCRDQKIQMKIKCGKLSKTEEIFEAIKVNDEFRDDLKEADNINVVRSYSNAVKRGLTTNRQTRVYLNPREVKRDVTCWSCQKVGHISRRYPERKKTCYACGSEHHLRRNCNKIRCSRCERNGHHTEECHTNLEKPKVWSAEIRQQNNRQRNDTYNRRYNENNRFPEQRWRTETNNKYRQRDNNRFVNTIMEEDEDCISRGDNIYYYDKETNSYREENPNEQAPSKVEMIGAMN